jgi:DNA repair protein RecN (Recombination protein N)
MAATPNDEQTHRSSTAMLVRLSIRDIVLIDRLDIDFGFGLAALTGETGAGKSIVLDAFALALGARGEAALVREGAEHGQVTAVFDVAVDHPARGVLAANDLGAGIGAGDELIVRRVQFADGRTRAFINDQSVSVQVLRAIGSALVEIHGQHDDRAFVEATTHRALLDCFGGIEAAAVKVRRLWEERREREAAVDARRADSEPARREAEWLRHAVDELGRLSPQTGEETSLGERRAAMMQAERAAQDLRATHETVAGPQSPVPPLATAVRRLERRAMQAPALIEPVVKAIDAALTALDEARTHLEQALRVADYDPGELDRIEERLFALRAAGRKYNAPVDELKALAHRYEGDLALIDAGAERLVALEREAEASVKRYREAAQSLSAERKRAAANLVKAVNAELKPLKLERARFSTQIEAGVEGPDGLDRIEFWVRTNPGTRPGPLMKVASGGELARFLLALKVVLADRGSAPTLIFDEIDTGAGGAVADAIGVRLARLASDVQVIAVTHAPQVAARAGRHYLIAKDALAKGKRVATRITELAAERRREEIARMLAGAEITAEARAAAERLLKAAS